MAITREQVLAALGGRGRPLLSARAILLRAGGHRGQAKALRALLRKLVAEKRLERVDRRYRLGRQDGFVEAVVQQAGGRPRLLDDAGGTWSLSGDDGLHAGDRVLLSPTPASDDGGAPVGVLLQILSGHRDEWIGIFSRDRYGTWVTPYRDDSAWRVRIGPSDGGQARFGEVVVVVPVSGGDRGSSPDRRSRGSRPGKRGKPAKGRRLRRDARSPAVPELRGRIVERLGRPGDAEADFRAVAWRHRLAREFSAAVLAEADAPQPGIAKSELERRLDLRDRCFLTIDPPSARDHDDAVCVEPVEGAGAGERYRLWVAIADVAHFVKPGCALDREALSRGNSFYFPDRAIPMLPERLSGDLCSLRPDTDRLALVVELLVEADGDCSQAKFHEAVIRSRERLAYGEAAEVMQGRRPPRPLNAGVCEQLERLAVVAARLLEHRLRNISLDFDLPAPEVLLDEHGRPRDIVRSERNVAHRAIEDAMLVANRAVARALSDRSIPTVFRVHEPPSEQRLDELRELFESLGLVQGSHAAMGLRQIAGVLQRVHGRPEELLINQSTLRSMSQARYHDENLGHYALGFDSYLHFTSPIRRYADLVVHREVKRHLVRTQGMGDRPLEEGNAAARDRMRSVSVRTSFRERVAVQVEREILDLKRCALMSSRVGEQFEGTTTGVAPHGLYVTLDAPFVDGLIHVSQLSQPGDFVDFDERGRALVARRSGRRYRLGERLVVKLISVDQVKGWISFGLARAEAG